MAEAGGWRGPLAGLRVLDLGHYYAGPMTAMLLADQGADVVRVVRPGAPELPDPEHRLLNRNKRLAVLDLAEPRDRERALRLALRADVVVESHRPGVMARHGLDHASLSGENPGLVHLSLPGFPSTDPARRDVQAWENVVAAAASLFQTGLRQRLGFPPQLVPAPICSAFASVHGAIAILAALLARERGLGGARLEVPLVDAGISTCTRSFVYDGARLRAATAPSDTLPPVVADLAIAPDDDDATRRRKADGLAALAPPIFTTHPYRTADGRRLMVMPIKPEMATRFFRILGLETRLRSEGFVIEGPWQRVDLGLGNDLASSWTLTRERSLRVIELVEERIASETADHWQRVFAEAGIPVAYLRTRAEWLATESLVEAGLLLRMDDGETVLTVPGPLADVTGPDGQRLAPAAREPVRVDDGSVDGLFSSNAPQGSEAPVVSSGDRVGRTVGEPPRRKAELLAGLKVLDLCNVVAGPNAAYTLAQLGADVVRVEPSRSFNLPMHLEWTLEVNQGKRSTILDVATAPGREAFERLVRWADVVVHNRLDDVAERLGLTPERLRAIDPSVVVCQNSAFGGVVPSDWDRIPGYDPMPNLTTGLDAAAGAPDAPRPMTEIFADLMGGLGTGFAAMLGLYQRARTGVAGSGRSSLVRGAHHYQLPRLIAVDGVARSSRDEGLGALGQSAARRLYACRDGWVSVGARPGTEAALSRVVAGDAGASEDALEEAFSEQPVEAWVARLREEGIGAHRVLTLEDLSATSRGVSNAAADEEARGALEVLRWDDHPSGLPILAPAPTWVRVGASASYRRVGPAPRVGAHTREVLAELGYAEGEIDRLYALRVAHDFLPAIGGPDAYFHQPERPNEP